MLRATRLLAQRAASGTPKPPAPRVVRALPEGFVPRETGGAGASAAPTPTQTATEETPAGPVSEAAQRLAANAADPEGVRVGLRAPKTDRTRSVVDSFRSLPSNTRIIIGIFFGICGFAGLWFDRQVGEDMEEQEQNATAAGEKTSALPISVRVVDRK